MTTTADRPGIWIELSWPELVIGAVIGCLRMIDSILNGRQDGHGFDGDGWGAHIEGALAEMAAAKALNIYWDASVGRFKDKELGDVGPYEVRRRSQQFYDVLIREDDDSDKIHIIVFGCAPRYRVAGWCFGSYAKQDKWWRTDIAKRDPAWFMPQSELRSLETIPR